MRAELFTDHLDLVSNFLSECYDRLRAESWVSTLHGRVQFGGLLSLAGPHRRPEARQRPPQASLPQRPQGRRRREDLDWAVRLALERRRRVKEQQKGTKSAEFRNTHFSYRIEGDSIDSSTVASCSPT